MSELAGVCPPEKKTQAGLWKRRTQHARYLVRGTQGRTAARHPKVAELKAMVEYSYKEAVRGITLQGHPNR